MKKKLVSVLVCAAMTAAVLAGCGNKAAETTDAPAAEETTEDAAVRERMRRLRRPQTRQLPES